MIPRVMSEPAAAAAAVASVTTATGSSTAPPPPSSSPPQSSDDDDDDSSYDHGGVKQVGIATGFLDESNWFYFISLSCMIILTHKA